MVGVEEMVNESLRRGSGYVELPWMMIPASLRAVILLILLRKQSGRRRRQVVEYSSNCTIPVKSRLHTSVEKVTFV